MNPTYEHHRHTTIDPEALLSQLPVAAATAHAAVSEQEEDDEHSLPDFRDRLERSLRILEPVGSLVRDQGHPVARRALTAVVTDRQNIDFGNRASALLRKLSGVERDLLRRVLVVTGHYESYINARGVVSRKRAIDRKFTPRFHIIASAEQIFAILGGMKVHYKECKTPPPPEAFNDIEDMLHALLMTPSGGVLGEAPNPGGFHFAPDFPQYFSAQLRKHSSEVQPMPRVTTLSDIPEEYAFIAIHQMFETLLFGVHQSLTNASSSTDHANGESIFIATRHLEAAAKLFPVLRKMISNDAFRETIRSCFVVASAAQSTQYHAVQHQIGLPESYEPGQYRMQLLHMIGQHAVADIEQRTEGAESLCLQHQTIDDPKIPTEIRRLVLANLRLKAAHGHLVCSYLDPTEPGSAGTQFTSYFAHGIAIPHHCAVFTPAEKELIKTLADKAVHRPSDPKKPQQTDCFEAIVQHLGTMSTNVPDSVFATVAQ